MPPPILNDSEDEDDDVVYDDPKDNSLSRSSAESAPGKSTLDGIPNTNDQSTGSTERLKRQIQDAQMSLFGDSNEVRQQNDHKIARDNSASPVMVRNKRVNSDNAASTPALKASGQTAKRTKTVTTYSTKKPSSSNAEREQFLAKFGQDAIAPNTSQSVGFSDHSEALSSAGLPTGSMQNDFMNHEPAMFKESGSTVPDNESSHQRMVEQALGSKPTMRASSPGIKLVASDEDPKSSSFPWSASEPTDSTRSNRMKYVSGPPATTNATPNLAVHEPCDQPKSHSEEGETAAPRPDALSEPSPAPLLAEQPPQEQNAQQSSPAIEVRVGQKETKQLLDQDPAEAAPTRPMSARGKRKVQEESSEPLNSDDIAVGLPKERYKPRPSKRRATHVAEEQIDYSVVPEKAARSKRSKTTGANQVKSSRAPDEDGRKSNTGKGCADLANTVAEGSSNDEPAARLSEPPKPSPVVEISAAGTPKEEHAESKEPISHASQISDKPQHDDFAFVKPAPKIRSAKKSKRSSTTIFEDHVDFAGKDCSPSLSQQQAMRKSALQDVKNEASPAPARRGRKPVILDEEDELASDPTRQDEQADEKPKKRGRGRPPKDAAKSSAAAASEAAGPSKNDTSAADDGQGESKVQPKKRRGRPPKSTISESKSSKGGGDSEADDNDELDGNDDEEDEEPPKKRRGRPPKSAPAANVDETKNPPTEASTAQQQKHGAPAKAPTKPPPAEEEEQIPSTKHSNASKIPTPSPEKQQAAAGAGRASETPAPPQPQPPKTSPSTHHSPIKNSSPAPYRVGLSKKHRIPSLLRVVRPPPPRKEK